MLVALLAAAAQPAPSPARQQLAALAGCWVGPGEAMGETNRTRVRASWRMGERYLLMEVVSQNAAETYQAAIIMAPAEAPAIRAFWMDTFGGAGTAAGAGQVETSGFSVSYAYPDATFINRFARDGAGWRWTIVQRGGDGAERPFASYRLSRAACRGFPAIF